MKNIKMTLLNSDELSEIQGGTGVKSGKNRGCNHAGDTIICNLMGKIKACATFEVACLPKFSSSCNEGSFSITGCSSVTFS